MMTDRKQIEEWIRAAEGNRATCQNLPAFDALIDAHRARLSAFKSEKMSMTPQFILQGVWYALEQCGTLLRDANVLYRSKSYASAVVLAAFAREEMGRSNILLEFWRKAAAGESFTIEQLKQACDDHVTKQQAGMLSLTMRTDNQSGLGKILQARMKNPPQSGEWKKANAQLKQIDDIKTKRTPSDRHDKRVKALYVEPISQTEWNRPSVTTATTAYEFLVDAVNEYRVRQDRCVSSADSILKIDDPELYNALQQWSGRPALQPIEAPQFPTG